MSSKFKKSIAAGSLAVALFLSGCADPNIVKIGEIITEDCEIVTPDGKTVSVPAKTRVFYSENVVYFDNNGEEVVGNFKGENSGKDNMILIGECSIKDLSNYEAYKVKADTLLKTKKEEIQVSEGSVVWTKDGLDKSGEGIANFEFLKDGKIIVGTIDPFDLTYLGEMQKYDLESFINGAITSTMLVTRDGVNFRKGAGLDTESLLKLKKETEFNVDLQVAPVLDESGRQWIYGKVGETTGWVSNEYLKSKPKLIGKVLVEDLKLRDFPTTSNSQIQVAMPLGASVEVISNVPKNGWFLCEYIDPDGNRYKGWSYGNDGEYLEIKNLEPVEKQKEKIASSRSEINTLGEVTAIDASYIAPEKLNEFLSQKTNQIDSASIRLFGDDTTEFANTSALVGHVSDVWLKCGGSSYGTGDMEIYETDQLQERFEVCRDNEANVGLYYYSTAITEEEMGLEIDMILKQIELFKSVYGEEPQLPLMFDVEMNSESDRHRNVDSIEFSKLVGKTIKRLEDEGMQVVLYTSPRLLNPNSGECIMNLDVLADASGYDKVPIIPSIYTDENGVIGERSNADLKYALDTEKAFFPAIQAYQNILTNSEDGGLVDLNLMYEEAKKAYTKGKRISKRAVRKILEKNRELVERGKLIENETLKANPTKATLQKVPVSEDSFEFKGPDGKDYTAHIPPVLKSIDDDEREI